MKTLAKPRTSLIENPATQPLAWIFGDVTGNFKEGCMYPYSTIEPNGLLLVTCRISLELLFAAVSATVIMLETQPGYELKQL